MRVRPCPHLPREHDIAQGINLFRFQTSGRITSRRRARALKDAVQRGIFLIGEISPCRGKTQTVAKRPNTRHTADDDINASFIERVVGASILGSSGAISALSFYDSKSSRQRQLS
jgi:hypothetical protein